MEKIPSWMERLLWPKLNEITGEDAVENEIASLRNEMISRFYSLEARLPEVERKKIAAV